MAIKLTIFLITFASLCIHAQNGELDSEACAKPEAGRSIAALDRFHTYCTNGIIKMSNKVDYFFGGIRVDEESNESYGRFSLEARFREATKLKLSTRIRVRLNLPGTEKKMKLIFDKGEEEGESGKISAQNPDLLNREEGFDTALRYVVKRKAKFNVNVDGGLRIRRHRPFNVFARLRSRFSWTAGDSFELRFVNTLYHFARTYGVVDTSIELDYSVKNGTLFRFGNSVRWEDRKDYFEFSNYLSIYLEISEKRSVGFHLVASGDDRIKTTYNAYSFFMQYRQQIYKDWLYIDLRPEARLIKKDTLESELGISVKFEFRFGNY